MSDQLKRILPVVLVIVVIGLVCCALFLRREPAYHNKSLRRWAQQYGSNHWGRGSNGAADKEATFAIQQVGTKGIPFLLYLMRKRDSAVKTKLRTIVPRGWHDI